MANNTELITGRGEDAHVSSFDMRAFNRAVFGTGKYRFTDAENMVFEVDTVGKTFVVKSGSCMWSGMHIRVEEEETVTFVSPATTANVYLWLHYKREPSTLIESVEFVSTTSSKVNTSLIYNELPDDVAEAYTLFATIEYDAANNLVRTTSNEFELVKGMSQFYAETTQKLTNQSAEIDGKVAELETNLNDTLTSFNTTIINTAYNAAFLFDGYIDNSSYRKEFDLEDQWYNYRVLVFEIENMQYVRYRPTPSYANTEVVIPLPLTFGSDAVTFRQIKMELYHKKIIVEGYNHTKIYRGPAGTYFDTSSSFKTKMKIYGIGKG